jgi:hypothetical protein
MGANKSPKLELLLVLKQSQNKSNARDARQQKCRHMWSYLVVPTYLMVLWWNFSPCLGWLKDGTFICVSPT